ncbi:MAG: geranylgeranyl reductase family protein [Planctomycetota bacterium]|nr:geranylgeranyl reductase family protein [Planctomycetota bacterium]
MRRAPDFDTAIVGGGPAGACAALLLARAGRPVVLFDREEHPRYKTCGGGLVRRALNELPIDLEELDGCGEAAAGIELFAAEMHLADSGLAFRVERPEPLLRMTMRSDLDHALLQAAASEGADVRQPCAVTGVAREGDPGDTIRLETEGGPVTARFVLAADGALSRTAAAAGWTETPELIPALESELSVPASHLERYASCARFDFDVVSDGYGWVFPKRSHLSVGVLSMRRGRSGLLRLLERYLERLGLDDVRGAEHHGFVIPVRPRPGPLARDRVLLLGDAAGLADPLTAEGISGALISGRLAAEALLAHDPAPGSVERAYHRALDRALLRDLAVARRMARVIYGSPRWRARLFRSFGQLFVEAMTAQISGEQTYRELLLRPTVWARLLRGKLRRSPSPRASATLRG